MTAYATQMRHYVSRLIRFTLYKKLIAFGELVIEKGGFIDLLIAGVILSSLIFLFTVLRYLVLDLFTF